MSNWNYLLNGQPHGPLETTAIQALINNGTINGDTLLLREGSSNWQPLREVTEFTVPPSATSAALPPPGSAIPPVGPPPFATDSDAVDIEKNKILAVLAYIGILFLVPLLAAPTSKFARYHANQGMVLFIASIVATVGTFILMMIPFVGCVAMLIPGASLALMILGIVNAAQGQYKPLPLIGHFQILK